MVGLFLENFSIGEKRKLSKLCIFDALEKLVVILVLLTQSIGQNENFFYYRNMIIIDGRKRFIYECRI